MVFGRISADGMGYLHISSILGKQSHTKFYMSYSSVAL